MKKIFTLFTASLIAVSSLFAGGHKCQSHTRQQKAITDNPALAYQVQQRKKLPASAKRTTSEVVYTIPVVVHVIHNGEAIGVGQNISDAQIQSAIVALNKDFRGLNSDTLKPTHPFYGLQADVKIEFCLAKQSPSGKSTNGIMRQNGGQAAWSVEAFDMYVIPETIWDHTKYLNIWTTTFAAPDEETLGYATFPDIATAQKDGMVIGATFFGTVGNLEEGAELNRTATHEVGHYLGLYHIWGDDTCGDDLVDDTPTQKEANTSICPTFPHNVSSECNPGANGEMYMNYMDYTTDNCMQLFTTGQKARMRAQFQQYRMSLATSNGCDIPTAVNLVTSEDVKVYPNPSSSNVNISAPSHLNMTTINLFDVKGNLVQSVQANGSQQTVNTSNLGNGNYVVQIIGENGVVNKALIIIQ